MAADLRAHTTTWKQLKSLWIGGHHSPPAGMQQSIEHLLESSAYCRITIAGRLSTFGGNSSSPTHLLQLFLEAEFHVCLLGMGPTRLHVDLISYSHNEEVKKMVWNTPISPPQLLLYTSKEERLKIKIQKTKE